MKEIVISQQELIQICAEKLGKTGISSEHAAIVADVLVHDNLRGLDSHGVMIVDHYINRIKNKSINTDPKIAIAETGPVTAIVDGEDGLGHIAAMKAMDFAIARVRTAGACLVGVINSSHCGALSYYVKQAANDKLIGVAMTNTDKAVVPFGGAAPFLAKTPSLLAFRQPSKGISF